MQRVIELIKNNTSKTYLDEDGNPLSISLNKGISLTRIESFEKLHNMKLPSELKELLLFTNGINLFGVEILSLETMEFFPEENKLLFHHWGNGDSDFIDENGATFFSAHSIENLIAVSPSLSSWLDGVIKEIKLKGTVLHPMDYTNREDEIGLYRKCIGN